MQATVEEIGPCKKKISIEIGIDQVKEKLDEKFTEFLKTAQISGFRKGHVPRGLAEKRYGEEIQGEVQESLMSEALEETLEENKFAPIGTPHFDNISFEEDKPFTYEVTVSVKPTITLDNYKGIEATRPAAEVTESDVTERVDMLRRNQAQVVPVENKPVEADHHLLASFKILVDEEEILKRESAYLVPAEDLLFGLRYENLAKELVGKEVGDTVDLNITLPDTYPKEEVRGKEAIVQVTITDIKTLELPELNEEWAKSLDYDSVDDVRAAVERRLEGEKKAQADAEVENQVIEAILTASPFDIPEDIIEHELHHMVERRQMEMEAGGMPNEAIEEELEKLKSEQHEAQTKRFREFFLLDQIAEAERLFATESDVEERINLLAASRGQRPSEVRHQLEESDSISQLRSEIREEKTRAFLREHAKVTEAKAEPAEKAKPTAKKTTKKAATTKKAKTTKKKKEDS